MDEHWNEIDVAAVIVVETQIKMALAVTIQTARLTNIGIKRRGDFGIGAKIVAGQSIRQRRGIPGVGNRRVRKVTKDAGRSRLTERSATGRAGQRGPVCLN